ncbi:hypothetical protein BASA81_014442 [Batrachochytrium salamandrivorans]|nr:hypothetical protein BASA81_014442 [Batrachochytrium salamandrivorans]
MEALDPTESSHEEEPSTLDIPSLPDRPTQRPAQRPETQSVPTTPKLHDAAHAASGASDRHSTTEQSVGQSSLPLQDTLPAADLIKEIDFEAYTDTELLRLQTELLRKVQFHESENTMLESYLWRVTPHLKDSDDKTDLNNGKRGRVGMGGSGQDSLDGQDRDKESRREKKKKGEKTKEADRPMLLTSEQKSEIATRELEELRDEIQHQQEEWEKLIDNYKAEIEEVEIRVSEIKKAMYEFKRDIVQQAVNQRTGKVMAEESDSLFEDKIRSKDATIEKVRLKNVTLKAQKNKLHLQLKQKEEMGEVLHAIDFDQLQIENKQYLQKIDERNAELLKLKLTAGKTVQTLNYYKKKLQVLSSESSRLSVEIVQRKDLLRKLISESEMVHKDKQKSERLNGWLLKQLDDYKVPDVMDYVLVKASQHDMKKRLKGWERKVEIATMQTQRMRKIWQKMSTEAEKSHTFKAQAMGASHHSQQVPELPKIKITH